MTTSQQGSVSQRQQTLRATAVALYVLGMAVVAGLLSALLNGRWISLLFWLLAAALMLFYWRRVRRRFGSAAL